VKGIVEKPKGAPPSLHFSPGRYVFTPDIFDYIDKTKPSPSGELYITDAVNLMARRRPVYGLEMRGRYYDCGNKTEYVKANIHFALKHKDLKRDIRDFIATKR
jgi:UTP--glucose-1-phosphate uridylyltransferase